MTVEECSMRKEDQIQTAIPTSTPIERDLNWFRSFVSERRWQRGKADPSHEYTIRDWVPSAEGDFERAVVVIRELGEPATFFSRSYLYLHIDGRRYWTMGSPVPETTVLNRARTPADR